MIVPGADGAAFWTPRSRAKVKRLRGNQNVDLRPCSRRGRTGPGAPAVRGRGEVSDDAQSLAQVVAQLRAKYGLRSRVVTLIESCVQPWQIAS